MASADYSHRAGERSPGSSASAGRALRQPVDTVSMTAELASCFKVLVSDKEVYTPLEETTTPQQAWVQRWPTRSAR